MAIHQHANSSYSGHLGATERAPWARHCERDVQELRSGVWYHITTHLAIGMIVSRHTCMSVSRQTPNFVLHPSVPTPRRRTPAEQLATAWQGQARDARACRRKASRLWLEPQRALFLAFFCCWPCALVPCGQPVLIAPAAPSESFGILPACRRAHAPPRQGRQARVGWGRGRVDTTAPRTPRTPASSGTLATHHAGYALRSCATVPAPRPVACARLPW